MEILGRLIRKSTCRHFGKFGKLGQEHGTETMIEDFFAGSYSANFLTQCQAHFPGNDVTHHELDIITLTISYCSLSQICSQANLIEAVLKLRIPFPWGKGCLLYFTDTFL